MEHHILTAALTGGIGTGKSVAARVFKELGCYVFYADEQSHVLMEPEKKAWEKIVDHFGKSILNKDNTINRKKLGKRVFSNKKERQFLNSVIHPLVNQLRIETIQKLKKKKSHDIFISEAALTIEAGFVDYFDKIIVAFCEKKIQIKRLMKRDGISEAAAKNKIGSQMKLTEKKKYADYLINTSGDINSTVEQTEKVYRNLVMDYWLLKN